MADSSSEHYHAYYLAAGGRIWWTDGRWRYESRAAANKAARQHQPEATRRMVRKCDHPGDPDLCPTTEPVPIWKRRDDR